MALDGMRLIRANMELRIEIDNLKRHIESLNERVRMAEAIAERERRQNRNGSYVRLFAAEAAIPQEHIMTWLEELWNQRSQKLSSSSE